MCMELFNSLWPRALLCRYVFNIACCFINKIFYFHPSRLSGVLGGSSGVTVH